MPCRSYRCPIKCQSFNRLAVCDGQLCCSGRTDEVKHGNPTSTMRPPSVSSPPRRTGTCSIGSFYYVETCPICPTILPSVLSAVLPPNVRSKQQALLARFGRSGSTGCLAPSLRTPKQTTTTQHKVRHRGKAATRQRRNYGGIVTIRSRGKHWLSGAAPVVLEGLWNKAQPAPDTSIKHTRNWSIVYK